MDKVFNYFIFLGFIYILYFSFKKNRSIFTPSNFFILLWFVNYSILMFFVRDFYLHYEGSSFILLMCTIVYFFGNIGLDYPYQLKKSIDLKQFIPQLKYVALFATLLGMLVYPLMIANVNGDLHHMFQLSYIKKVGTVVSYMRYKIGYDFPFRIQLLLGINYFACLVSGAYFSYLYLKRNYLYWAFSFICIISSIFITFVTTEKAIIIYSLMLFCSGFIVSYNTISKEEFKCSKKSLMMMPFGFLFLFLLFIYIQMNRYGFDDWDGFKYVLSRFKVYAFGHISAFSVWFKYHAGNHPIGFGRYTFAGTYSLLHLSNREPGIFTDYAEVSYMSYTNVYTVFRSLISDFTIVGSCILLAGISFVAGIAYRFHKKSITLFLYLMGFYSFSLLSLITSFLNYNTIIGAFGLFYIILLIMNYVSDTLKNNL